MVKSGVPHPSSPSDKSDKFEMINSKQTNHNLYIILVDITQWFKSYSTMCCLYYVESM